MKYCTRLIILLLFISSVTNAQTAKKIFNKEHAAYEHIPGTQLEIILPKNYSPSKRFNGYENPLSAGSIMYFKVPGSINENMLAFKRNKDIRQGMVVAKEEMYKINGYDALLQSGVQFAHGRAYMRYVFVIGDLKNTYVLNSSWVKDKDFEREAKRLKESMLSIIFSSNDKSQICEAFEFSINPEYGNLKAGNILMNSLVFTDDGQIPSETEAKTAFMINESLIPKGASRENYITKIMEAFPIEFSKNQDMSPKPIVVDGLDGLECYGIGQNTKLGKSEIIYIVILFDGTCVYQLTGTSLKNFEEALTGFKKMARSFTRHNSDL